ncbi:MAG: hypothetical protein MJE66_09575 [Proteobacteria bacterium]|nr:hypothetical protein [Pseudomonadota bacterium]
MREFAQTYVQLANQAADLPAEDQLRLKRAHDLAQVMVDGMYRAQSTPFLCHLVRTASICLAERQPRVVVEAALLHATYLLHRFRNTRRHGLAARHAARLRRVVGEEVEALVRTYGALPFDSPEDVARHSAGLAAASPSTRQALVIALANELEDHLDGAMLYGGPARAPDALQARALECSLLAERLDLPVLAGELREVFDRQRSGGVPDALQTGHRYGYELESGTSWRATFPERVLWWLVRTARRLRSGN